MTTIPPLETTTSTTTTGNNKKATTDNNNNDKSNKDDQKASNYNNNSKATAPNSNTASNTTNKATNNNNIDYIGYTTHIAAIIMAYMELQDDIVTTDLTHAANGVCLLVASKVCREVHALRGLVAVNNSDAPMDTQRLFFHRLYHPLRRVLHTILCVLSSTWTATLLALGALAAALTEVIGDDNSTVPIGGHHGAVLLAIIDLIELSQEAGIIFHGGRRLVKTIMEFKGLKLSLAALATLFAIMETFDGGGETTNGILALSVLKFVRTTAASRQVIVRYLQRRAGWKRLLKLLDKWGVLRNEWHGGGGGKENS